MYKMYVIKMRWKRVHVNVHVVVVHNIKIILIPCSFQNMKCKYNIQNVHNTCTCMCCLLKMCSKVRYNLHANSLAGIPGQVQMYM